MPPRVTYWTGTWDPRQEAISQEVQLLRTAGGASHPVVSFSPGQRSALRPADRVVQLSARRWMLVRAIAAVVERYGAISHVFGGFSSWHLLRAVGRRPVVLTVAIPGDPPAPAIRANVSYAVAESEPLVEALRRVGLPADRVRLIYPGVDLGHFTPGPDPSARRFRLLFASSPSDAAEFERRGIPLLVETARRCPEIDVVFLWRQWGDQHAARRALARLAPPPNVSVELASGREMPEIYRSADAVACLYEDGFGKSCPNSVVEALACGVPVVVSSGCGIAGLVSASGAGIAVPRAPETVVAAVRRLHETRAGWSDAARALAERAFDVRRFLDAYARLYDEITSADADRAPARSR